MDNLSRRSFTISTTQTITRELDSRIRGNAPTTKKMLTRQSLQGHFQILPEEMIHVAHNINRGRVLLDGAGQTEIFGGVEEEPADASVEIHLPRRGDRPPNPPCRGNGRKHRRSLGFGEIRRNPGPPRHDSIGEAEEMRDD